MASTRVGCSGCGDDPHRPAADPEGAAAVLVAFVGFLIGDSRRPSVPGIPALRPFRRAQGEAALERLRTRLR